MSGYELWTRPRLVTRGLVAHYDFKSGYGSQKLYDQSNGMRNGSLSATPPTWVNEGLNFNGTNNFVDTNASRIGNTGLFTDSTETYTVMIVASGAAGPILARAGSVSGNRNFQLRGFTTTLSLQLRGTLNTVIASYDTKWHCHIVRWDGTTAIYRMDNGNSFTCSVGSVVEETTQRIIIGAVNNGSTLFFGGNVAICLIYDNALNDSELSQNCAVIKQILNPRGIYLP